MFPEPPRPKLHLSNHFMLVRGDAAYQQYTGKTRIQCDECVWTLHEARGVGEPPRSARQKRVTTRNGLTTVMFLCAEHANLWREADGR
jgi:hypothetical protein